MMGSPVHSIMMTLPEQIWTVLRKLIRMHALLKH